jgi:hypothetical protein
LRISCSFKSAHISEILLAAYRTLVGDQILDRDDGYMEAEGVGACRSRESCFEGNAGWVRVFAREQLRMPKLAC